MDGLPERDTFVECDDEKTYRKLHYDMLEAIWISVTGQPSKCEIKFLPSYYRWIGLACVVGLLIMIAVGFHSPDTAANAAETVLDVVR